MNVVTVFAPLEVYILVEDIGRRHVVLQFFHRIHRFTVYTHFEMDMVAC